MGARGFVYDPPDGRRVTEATEISRLNIFAILTAYTDVAICTNSFSNLQA